MRTSATRIKLGHCIDALADQLRPSKTYHRPKYEVGASLTSQDPCRPGMGQAVSPSLQSKPIGRRRPAWISRSRFLNTPEYSGASL
jgi:hypothetical protein